MTNLQNRVSQFTTEKLKELIVVFFNMKGKDALKVYTQMFNELEKRMDGKEFDSFTDSFCFE